MVQNVFMVHGKMRGNYAVSKMLTEAPERFRRTLLKWLLQERDSFVGNKKKDGVFRRKLMRRTSSRGWPWEARVARVFRGEVENDRQINDMRLHMGAGLKGERPFVRGLRTIAYGGTITSPVFMPIPIYGHLKSKAAAYRQFRQMNEADQLVAIRTGGKVLWVDKEKIEQGADVHQAALFVGVKRIDIKPHFNFDQDWANRVPQVVNRGQKALDRATKRAERSGEYNAI